MILRSDLSGFKNNITSSVSIVKIDESVCIESMTITTSVKIVIRRC